MSFRRCAAVPAAVGIALVGAFGIGVFEFEKWLIRSRSL